MLDPSSITKRLDSQIRTDTSRPEAPAQGRGISASSIPTNAARLLSLIWDFTESNFSTFVLPNSAFGILSAFAACVLTNGPQPTPTRILQRLPVVMAFNWYNVLNFDLANQWSPQSVEEDRVNKPWRPIPTGKATSDQARRAMLFTVPAALVLNYCLGVWRQGLFIQVITWLYNDIRGGDEVVRDLLIAVAYGCFNSASLNIAVGAANDDCISNWGFLWTTMISGVILTTMQVQDLKDQAGDRLRGRQTVALWLGDQVSRVSIAVFVCFWTVACAYFWSAGPLGYALPGVTGAVVALRVLLKREPVEDSHTWKCWCLWTVTLYGLPTMHTILPPP